MRKCMRCNCDMVEDLVILTNDAVGLRIGEAGLFKGTLGKIAAAACPSCGYVETYLQDTEKLKAVAEEKAGE